MFFGHLEIGNWQFVIGNRYVAICNWLFVIDNLQFCMVWYGLVWFGMVWYGLVWFGLLWFGCYSLVWGEGVR